MLLCQHMYQATRALPTEVVNLRLTINLLQNNDPTLQASIKIIPLLYHTS